MKLKNKKELQNFIDNREKYIDILLEELNKNGIKGEDFQEYASKVDEIQKFYEDEFYKKDEFQQEKLRLAFWSFFSKLIMEKLGGELKIASPTDYSDGTPQLINYGNRYDKKGKKKWIGIAFDSWLNTHLKGLNNFSLKEKVDSLIKDYS
jgi:hypothetical protein